MKKILIITLEYPPTIGGIATYVHQFADAYKKDKVTVLAPVCGTRDACKEWDAGVQYRVIRKHLLFPRFLWPRWVRLLFIAWKLVKKEQFEMIHVHHALPAGYAAWVIEKFLHVPYLVFFHGADITSAKSTTPRKKKLLHAVANKSLGIVVNSEGLKKQVAKQLPDLKKDIVVLYPSADRDFHIPPKPEEVDALRKQYALDGKKVMLSVSRISEGKGFPHLAHMLPALLKKIPNLVWMIVGDGPKRKQLQEQIQKNNLQNVVRFVGKMPPEKLKPFYYLADVFTLLTHPDEERGVEGFGIVFLEAAAAGLPVVAGKTGGVEEAVVHTQTGLVVDIYQETQVIEAITSLVENSDYAARLASNAEARAASHFQWASQMKKLDHWLQ